jgi:hypothetical protein
VTWLRLKKVQPDNATNPLTPALSPRPERFSREQEDQRTEVFLILLFDFEPQNAPHHSVNLCGGSGLVIGMIEVRKMGSEI